MAIAEPLAEIYQQLGENDDAHEQYLLLADHYCSSGDLAEAQVVLRAALALEVNDLPCWQRLAQIALMIVTLTKLACICVKWWRHYVPVMTSTLRRGTTSYHCSWLGSLRLASCSGPS